jgi:phosphoenolpyruvate carboxylase
MAIKPAIRSLYRIIGNLVGKQIWNRINFDSNISTDSNLRKQLAYEFIDYISAFRNILKSEDRDLSKVLIIFNKISEKPEYETKIFAWILEAYLLLNQSSTASADVSKNKNSEILFARKLINFFLENKFSKEEILKIFSKDLSANLVLTAHPTAGIQPDYMHHISNMIEKVNSVADTIRDESSQEKIDEKLELIKEDLAISISHMIRVKPYNENKLKPSDESQNFLKSISQIYEIIPETLVVLGNELSKALGEKFYIHPEFFKLHSWVARDIDGNPTVNKEEHFKTLINENLHFYKKYFADIQRLWQTLSDDFTFDKELPSKTFFINSDFKRLYDNIITENPVYKSNKQAYRLVIDHKILHPLAKAIDSLETQRQRIAYTSDYNFDFDFDKYCSEETLLAPLKAIIANKEGVNSKEIEIIIKKIEIFGKFGSHGHTRQGNEVINFLTENLSGFKVYGDISEKTDFLLKAELNREETQKKIIDLKEKLTDSDGKLNQKAIQTLELLSLTRAGGIKRQIISMNTCFEDMLNTLILSKYIISSSSKGSSMISEDMLASLEIVPLTEQISDLRNSYKCTVEALSNKAWRLYLLKHRGEFIKMRGPSDSGKQNGFTASQWEMFRSKQLDTIVTEIFNAFLDEYVFNEAEESLNIQRSGNSLKAWQDLLKNKPELEEALAIKLAMDTFSDLFQNNFSSEEKALWLRVYESQKIKQVKLINFDGWGEPIERGGGLEFRRTATCTQPIGSNAHYERTLQGGGAQQLISFFKSHEMIQEFIFATSEISGRKLIQDKLGEPQELLLDPKFVKFLNSLIERVRKQLREEVFGLDLNDDNICTNENTLREYFAHVIKSPLIYLDIFNIASRPTSRSGAKVKGILSDPEYNNDLDILSKKLSISEILGLLADIRAIPYSAMFNLLGGNHVSFYGYQGLDNDAEFIQELNYHYHQPESKQETRLLKHIIDSLERGIFTADMAAYSEARKIIESASNPHYRVEEDKLLQKLIIGNRATKSFIAKVKGYKVSDPENISLKELLQNNPEERDLLLARRDDAVIPRLGLAYSINKIIRHCKENELNPLSINSIPLKYLDLLRKAFSAGASTFGNGCID